jgi:hypothetical protein
MGAMLSYDVAVAGWHLYRFWDAGGFGSLGLGLGLPPRFCEFAIDQSPSNQDYGLGQRHKLRGHDLASGSGLNPIGFDLLNNCSVTFLHLPLPRGGGSEI